MSYRQDPGKFNTIWVNTASDTIVTQILKRDGSTVEDYFLNEGIADFFSGQWSGGVSYFIPIGSSAATGIANWTDPMSWCRGQINRTPAPPMAPDDKPLRCLEDNFGAIVGGVSPNIQGTTTPKESQAQGAAFNEKVAFVASTLHDVFDGWPNTPVQNVPGNGGAWIFDTSKFLAPTSPFTTSAGFFLPIGSLNDTAEAMSSVIHEENIHMPGFAFQTLIIEWLRREPSGFLPTLNQETFFLGLSAAMLSFAAPPDEICRLYELHQPNDTCPPYGPTGVTGAPPKPLYECLPGTTLHNGVCVGDGVPDPG